VNNRTPWASPARFAALALVALGPLPLGCGARSSLYVPPECDEDGATRPCESICGSGTETCMDGTWQACDAPRPFDTITLAARIRDFSTSHPDFEHVIGDDRGIVEDELGADGLPVYASATTTATTNGAEAFDQWYRDMPGINESTDVDITLARVNSLTFQYVSNAFFPIDDELLGNQGLDHNYHFTLQLDVDFQYLGGEQLTFTGDDDVWVFVNGRLAIDLGGVHGSQSQTVSLDAVASSFGLEPRGIYPLALFFAERHTSSSTFRIDTSITEFDACPSLSE
jgi:fibro-slime domain-containing protein